MGAIPAGGTGARAGVMYNVHMEVNDQTLTELVRLTRDNNRILHKMRRNAFWGGLIKLIIYGLIFIAAPLWIYATYLAPITEQLLDTYSQVQGTGAQAQAQISQLQDLFDKFKIQFPSSE